MTLSEDASKLFDFSKTTLSPVQQLYVIAYATRGTKKGACELAGVPFPSHDTGDGQQGVQRCVAERR